MHISSSRRRTPEVFAPDSRPGADAFVYCKGCGAPLEGEARHVGYKHVVNVMMCEPCRQIHGHQLIPASGTASYCYRCGGPDEIFVGHGIAPATYHVCPRCVPDRAARYRAGNFDALRVPLTAEHAEAN
jgi:hypothetical protein